MKNFIAVVRSTSGKVDKYQDFDLETDADTHVIKFGGFVAINPGDQVRYWVSDHVAKTLLFDTTTKTSDIEARVKIQEDYNAARQQPIPSSANSVTSLRDDHNSLVERLTTLGVFN